MDNSIQPNNTVFFLEYRKIFEEIGQQLKLRKSSLFKRTLIIVCPYLLLIVVSYIFNLIYIFDSLSSEQRANYYGYIIVYLIMSAIWSQTIRFIFKIEKQIWVDSFFDKKNLEPSESWKIAKKLFWPALFFRMKLWLQYYFVPIGIAIAVFSLGIYVFVPNFNNPSGYEFILNTSLVLFLFIVIGIIAYGYYLKTKLRYAWFIFLDKFGTEYSYKIVLEDMKKLNDISKSETFKKSLILSIGANTLNSIAQFAISSMSHSLSRFGDMGKMTGKLISIYGNEASRQVTDLGNISAQYVLYRFARKEAYGVEQEVNENIYNVWK